jgi:hypothetical protein
LSPANVLKVTCQSLTRGKVAKLVRFTAAVHAAGSIMYWPCSASLGLSSDSR